jgi:hypothetical protein
MIYGGIIFELKQKWNMRYFSSLPYFKNLLQAALRAQPIANLIKYVPVTLSYPTRMPSNISTLQYAIWISNFKLEVQN